MKTAFLLPMKWISAICLIAVFSNAVRAQEVDLSPGKKFVFKDATFKRGSAAIDPASYPRFEKLLAYLAARPDLDIEIGGHADNQGNPKTNLALSRARADAVKAFLVQRGIAADRLFTKGYGDTQPIADNSTDDGRSQNRRIEVVGLSPRTERSLTTQTNTPISPDGTITAIQRDVRARAPWETAWSKAILSQPVYEYHRINTAAASRSTVTFLDRSALQIGENALVVIYGVSEEPQQRPTPTPQVGLLSGDLYVKLAAARQQPPLSVRTRAAEIALANSSGKIGSDAKGRSLVSIHRGGASVRGLKTGASFEAATPLPNAPVAVPENFGTRIAENTPPEQPRPLPNPPELIAPTSPVENPIQFRWRATAAQTRLDISPTDEFDTLVFTTTNVAESATASLNAGRYFLKLTSIDSIGLESRPLVLPIDVIGRSPRRLRLTLRAPELERGVATNSVIIINGETEPGATIFVNGDSIARADNNGAVRFSVALTSRFNDINVVAKDDDNIPARQSFSVDLLMPRQWVGFLGMSVSPSPSASYGNGVAFRGGVEYRPNSVFSVDAEALAGRLSGIGFTPDAVLLGAGVGASVHAEVTSWAAPFAEVRASVATYQGIGVAFSPALGGGVRFNADAVGFLVFARYNFLLGNSFQEQLGATRILDFGFKIAF